MGNTVRSVGGPQVPTIKKINRTWKKYADIPLISEGGRQIDLTGSRRRTFDSSKRNPVKLEEHSTPLGQQALSCATPHAVY